MSFLKNTWYVAAHARELEEEMVSRKICDELIVIYRKKNGDVAAMEDRCPHRFVPLSMGKRIEDTIQCGYHGLRFDDTGTCVEAPNDDESQRVRACIRAYVAVERHSFIWLWLGDRELADVDKIPDFSFMDDPTLAHARGYSYIKANYQSIADNLLDLSHIHYLHPGIHEGSNFKDFTNKVKLDGDNVWSMLWRHHYHVDPMRQHLFGFSSDDVEGQGHSRWTVPGVLQVSTAFWEHGKSIDEGIRLPNAHLLTPETEFTTHYFHAAGRNFHIDNDAITKATEATMKNVFETQDGPMVEAQQIAMGNSTDFLDQQPIILHADAAGVMARRIMKKRLREEQGLSSPDVAAAE